MVLFCPSTICMHIIIYHLSIHPFIRLSIHPFIQSCFYSAMHSCIYPFIHSSIHQFIRSSIHAGMQWYIHPSKTRKTMNQSPSISHNHFTYQKYLPRNTHGWKTCKLMKRKTSALNLWTGYFKVPFISISMKVAQKWDPKPFTPFQTNNIHLSTGQREFMAEFCEFT